MREQSLPLTQAPDLLEIRLAETFNSNENGELLKVIERLPYLFNIVNLKSAANEKNQPNNGKVFFLTQLEYELLKKKIPKWKNSWFFLLVDVVGEDYPDTNNLIVLDQNTREQIPALLELINEEFCQQKKKQLAKNALKNFQVLGKESVSFLEELQDSFKNRGEDLGTHGKSALGVMETIYQHYGEFHTTENFDELDKLLKKVIGKEKLIKSIQIYEDFDLLLSDDMGGGMILPLVHGDKSALALYRFPKKITPITPFYTYFLHSMLSTSFAKVYPRNADAENALWEEAFSRFPFPCAMITQTGELILHNPSFSKLNLSPVVLSKLSNQEKIESQGTVFEMNRLEINRGEQQQSILMLMSDNSKIENNSGSSEELGIISSSIAHELNNPLAGILAMISVLELEDEWLEDAEVTQGLIEMKQSGRRCKDLIEIFLGFSKAFPNAGETDEINENFLKSLELIRFRTIESNVRFEFSHHKGSSPFKRELNTSVVSMMFYLILNEILTSFSHHKLVSGAEDNVLKGHFYEHPTKIIIEMEKGFRFQKALDESKLIQHLLDLLGISLQVEDKKIILSEWTLT
ncbi:MAG: signal transduction histidine kinase [Bacteriovoracaceae bacterium]|jgi:signal transduction histidine kinase